MVNINDWSPETGQRVRSDGSIANEADGINADGSHVVENKANSPVLIDTIPYSAFTASSNLVKNYQSKLNPIAKSRTFTITNSLNQALSSVWIDSSGKNPILADSGDSFQVVATQTIL